MTTEIARWDEGNVFAIGWRLISNGARIKPAQNWFGARKPNKGEDCIILWLGRSFKLLFFNVDS